MADQDWTPVTVTKTAKQRTAGMSSAQAISQAKIEGSITSERRFGTAENKSAHSAVGSNLKKLEDSTEDFKHAVIDKSLSKAITATRLAKKMTQADLARLINERPQIIQEYESGKAIPNGAILSKLDKALGTHLPRGKK